MKVDHDFNSLLVKIEEVGERFVKFSFLYSNYKKEVLIELNNLKRDAIKVGDVCLFEYQVSHDNESLFPMSLHKLELDEYMVKLLDRTMGLSDLGVKW